MSVTDHASVTDLASSSHSDPLSFLGFGFHIYGLSDLATSTTQAVMAAHDNATQSNPTDPYTYSSNAYTSRTQVEDALAGEVGLDVSAGAFSSEFHATWSSRNSDEENSAYGLCDIVVPTSLTALTNVGETWWAEGFAADPDVRGLPEQFNADTREHFFRVLRNYGTHFVSHIGFGGRLRATSSLTDTSQVSQQDATANMKAEYGGFFADVSGSGSASWSSLDQQWTSQRTFEMNAVGGDPSLAPLGDHAYGATFDPRPWIASVADAPAPASFQLTSLASAFSGQTQSAMRSAVEAFLDSTVRLVIDATLPQSYATIGSTRVTAPAPDHQTDPTADPAWLWVLLLDPNDLSVLLNQTFTFGDGDHPIVPQAPGGEVDTAVSSVQSKHPHLIVMFGGYWGWRAATAIPQSLQALAELNSFEQSSIPGFPDYHGCTLSYVGTTVRSDRYAATSAQEPLSCSNTVNVGCEPTAIIDQDGCPV